MKYSIQSISLIVALLITSSCGLFIQDSVTFHGTQCSDSRFWMGADLAGSGSLAYLLAQENAPSESYLPAAALLLSAAAGYYKRENCKAHQLGASPEEWARDAEQARQRDARQAQAMATFGAALVNEAAKSNSKSDRKQSKFKKYHKKIYFKCNGEVLFNETFKSFRSCDAFRRNSDFYCSGMRIPIQC